MNGRVTAEAAGVVLATALGSLTMADSDGLRAGGVTVSSLAKDWRRRGMKRSAISVVGQHAIEVSHVPVCVDKPETPVVWNSNSRTA